VAIASPRANSNLAVDDGLPFNVEAVSNPRELADPIVAVAGVGPPVVTVDPELDAVAIVFDFMNP
jgi:hypothetical protein